MSKHENAKDAASKATKPLDDAREDKNESDLLTGAESAEAGLLSAEQEPPIKLAGAEAEPVSAEDSQLTEKGLLSAEQEPPVKLGE
jgi:hypothetical protein